MLKRKDMTNAVMMIIETTTMTVMKDTITIEVIPHTVTEATLRTIAAATAIIHLMDIEVTATAVQEFMEVMGTIAITVHMDIRLKEFGFLDVLKEFGFHQDMIMFADLVEMSFEYV